MKPRFVNLILYLLALGCTVMPATSAHAQLNLQEREHVQTIVWIVEAATFATAIAIALFVWRISKRARKRKDRALPVDKNDSPLSK